MLWWTDLCRGANVMTSSQFRGPSTLGGDRVPRIVEADIDSSRAEYARQESSTLDPDISETIRNIQNPSTLGGDRVLSVPRSVGGLLGSRISVLVARCRILGLALFRAIRPAFIVSSADLAIVAG